MSSYKYTHLTLDDRISIQKALKERKTFIEIAKLIARDPSTVSKEVKGNSLCAQTRTRSIPYNPCLHRKKCTKTYICGSSCHVTHFLHHRQNYCSLCSDCNANCSEFVEYKCPKLLKAPYVCNPCGHIKSCTLEKKMYDAKEAQRAYERRRSESRQGIDLTPEELARLDEVVFFTVIRKDQIKRVGLK